MKQIKERVLAIFDSHYPYNLPLDTLLEFARDMRPTTFILGGDNWDLSFLSHWNEKTFKTVGYRHIRNRLAMEARKFGEQLDQFREAMPKAKFVYITGNHEDWLRQFAEDHPQMLDMSLGSLLQFKKRRIMQIQQGHCHKIGKLNFVHGDQYGSENPAKQALARTHHPVVFGHHHNHITWTDFSDVNSREKHVAHLVPCYCHRAPEYGKGRPNRWLNGFFWAYIKPSGKFSCGVQLVDPEGQFISQAGKEYR